MLVYPYSILDKHCIVFCYIFILNCFGGGSISVALFHAYVGWGRRLRGGIMNKICVEGIYLIKFFDL